MRRSRVVWSVRLNVGREPKFPNHTLEAVSREGTKLRIAGLQQLGVSVHKVPARKEQLQLLSCFLLNFPRLTVYTNRLLYTLMYFYAYN